MAGTVTVSEDGYDPNLSCITFAWTSDASGDATATTTKLSGTIEKIVFVPGSGGTQPTNLYDVVLNDQDSFDVLRGKGANLSNTTSTQHVRTDGSAVLPYPTCGALSLAVSNAGNAKTGTIRIFFRR